MISFFNAPERIARLVAEANAWLGTPWCANSTARGQRGGVSCHNLPREIYITSGFLTETFPKLAGDPNASRFTKVSAMEAWLDTRPEFARVAPAGEPTVELLQPGDLVGLAIGPCVNHLGIVLRDGNFIHVLMRKNTDLDLVNIPPWSQRIQAAWRPLETTN